MPVSELSIKAITTICSNYGKAIDMRSRYARVIHVAPELPDRQKGKEMGIISLALFFTAALLITHDMHKHS